MKSRYKPRGSIRAKLRREHSDVSSFASAFLAAPLDTRSPEALLDYFQSRSHIQYFALKPGKRKHVERADRILRHEFDLNNESHTLAENFDWMANPSRDPEWLILLHKFYYSRDLALAYDHTGDERYARKWAHLVDSWIRQVPDGFVNSQVTGRRLQQWLIAYHYFVPGRGCPVISADFLIALLRSIHSQALFLSGNLTSEGNHRTIEIYALFAVAVLFPELRESSRLLAFSRRELLENLRDDLLPDGVQKELSTDYHHTTLKNFLRVRELADLNGVGLADEFDEWILKALAFSIHVHKPDGFLPAINDGDVNSYLSLLRKAHRYYPNDELLYVSSQGNEGTPPRQRSRAFADSGYCVLRSDWTAQPYRDGHYFFFDCGNLGFGSHGHYDLLGFEAAAFGRSLLVDPGRYTYHEDGGDGVNWRHRFKGTAAHNTVMVDGLDQIPYRCERPAGPEPEVRLREFVSTPGFDFVHGSARSPQYPVEHRRSVFFAESEYWIITDLLTDAGRHRYDQFFHLAADALGETRLLAKHQGRGIGSPNLLIMQPNAAGIGIAIEQGFVSPEYGIKHPAPVIRFTQQVRGTAVYQTVLYPYRNVPPELRVNAMPVTSPRGLVAAHQALALGIRIQLGDATYDDRFFVAHEVGGLEFRFDDIACRTQVLFLRRNAGGEVLSLQAEGLERLRIGSRNVVDRTGTRLRLSYTKGRLFLASGERAWEGASTGLDRFFEAIAEFTDAYQAAGA